MWSELHRRIYDELYKQTPHELAERCFDLSGRKRDVFAFAEGLGIGIILNSQMERRVPFLAMKAQRCRLETYGYKDDPEESRIYYDQKEDRWYIHIDDAFSKGTQREIIAYDVAKIVLVSDYKTKYDLLYKSEAREQEDEFVSCLLGLLDVYDEPETPDELEVVE